jgi:hypothetical protein
MRALRASVLAGLVALLVLIVDAYFYKDPFIDLGNGYVLSAESPGTLCDLSYMPSRDSRRYSGWVSREELDAPMKSEDRFSLWNPATGEYVTAPSREEWLRLRRQYGARPVYEGSVVPDVRSFRKLGQHVIGSSSGGWFILDVDNDTLDLYQDSAEWETQLRGLKGARDVSMYNPGSPFVHSGRPALYGSGLLATAFVTWWAWRSPRKASGAEKERV